MANPSHIFLMFTNWCYSPTELSRLSIPIRRTSIVNPVASAVSIADTDGSSTINQANSDLRVGQVSNGTLPSGKYEFFATASGGDARALSYRGRCQSQLLLCDERYI